MKPCPKNLKMIAWLAAGELDPAPAEKLRAHLGACRGCRDYFEEMANVVQNLYAASAAREFEVSPAFQRKLASKLQAVERPSLFGIFRERFWDAPWAPRLAVASGAALLAALLALGVQRHLAGSPVKPELPVTVSNNPHAAETAPTLAHFRKLASQSPAALDEYLDRQADQAPASAMIYRASTFAAAESSN
jgi:anti-sigma factor RsiW